jgi:hypothetical protein
MNNRGLTVAVPIVTGYNGIRSVYYLSNLSYFFSDASSGSDVATMTRWAYLGDQLQNVSIGSTGFIRVKGKASNRGLGSLWADINCGAW